jgi:hypothetical protein
MSDTNLPTVMTSAGLQPQTPAALLAQLIALVAATNPGYTANLPASLVEDVSSTDVGALVICDQFRVELVNSLTPYGANPFLLTQLGNIYGVMLGQATNTSVFCVFTGPAGYVISQGFTVSDGTNQYTTPTGGVIGTGGTSLPIFFIATASGSWAVPIGTVTQIITSVPPQISLSVTNPLAGLPSTGTQSESDYRAAVLQAGKAASQGMPSFLKTLLGNVPGVQPRLVSVIQNPGGGWEVICGGGDSYQVAYAIFQALFDVSILVGSTMAIDAITNANPGKVTTVLNHGLTSGQVINIAGVVGMTGVNNTPLTITVVDEKNFTIGIDTTSSGSYVSGGVVTPNPRNISVNIINYPDVYVVPYVNPPQQTVTMTVTWNTTATNVVNPASIAQLAQQGIANYVNALPVGVPMNLFELQAAFQNAVAPLLPAQLLTRMVFAVSINGVGVSPSSGTGIIAGDPESYFSTTPSSIVVTQG